MIINIKGKNILIKDELVKEYEKLFKVSMKNEQTYIICSCGIILNDDDIEENINKYSDKQLSDAINTYMKMDLSRFEEK